MERCRLYRVTPSDPHGRYCALSVSQTLFGEWFVEQEWGRRGDGGSIHRDVWSTEALALEYYGLLKHYRLAHGYVETDNADQPGEKQFPGGGRRDRYSSKFGSAFNRRRWVAEDLKSSESNFHDRNAVSELFIAFIVDNGLSKEDVREFCYYLLSSADAPERYPLKRFVNRRVAGPNIVKFTPRLLHDFLDRELSDYFSATPRFFPLISRLEAVGIRRLGNLVQLSDDEFGDLVEPDREIGAHLRDHLNRCGLDFGSRVPTWTAPKHKHSHRG